MALFAKTVNGSFTKSSILDLEQDSQYAFATTEAYLTPCQTKNLSNMSNTLPNVNFIAKVTATSC